MPVDREGQDQLQLRQIRVYRPFSAVKQCYDWSLPHCGRNVLCALWMPSGHHWTITVSISSSLHGNTSVVFHLSCTPLDEHVNTHTHTHSCLSSLFLSLLPSYDVFHSLTTSLIPLLSLSNHSLFLRAFSFRCERPERWEQHPQRHVDITCSFGWTLILKMPYINWCVRLW